MRTKKEKRQCVVDVDFWYYSDGKKFLPLFASFGGKLSKDEENVITIMRAQNSHNVKKAEALIVFDQPSP